MRRREFITLLGGAAAWPLAARAQQGERVRRIGVLLPASANDDAFQDRIGAFLQGLQQSGWGIGRNVRIDTRWATNNPTEIRRHAAELAALAPDVVVAFAASTVGAMLQATRSVPIVFPGVADPVAAGFVDSLARPGRNATGFLLFEYGMAGKLLELLKEIAPGVMRAAVLRDPATPSGPAQFGVIQAAASSLRVEVSLINMRDAPEIEQAVAAFAHSPNNGLIVPASGSAAVHRTLIIMLAARHRRCRRRPYTLPNPWPWDWESWDINFGTDAYWQRRMAERGPNDYWVQLIHELTHVWQGHNSIFPIGYIFNSLWHRAVEKKAYDYSPGEAWGDYNVEQQAHLVQDWYANGCTRTDVRFPYVRDYVWRARA